MFCSLPLSESRFNAFNIILNDPSWDFTSPNVRPNSSHEMEVMPK